MEQAIDRSRGSGQALDPKTREQMDLSLGADFSGVRVHTNSEANALNQSLNARAFTTGKDIYFRQGDYNPGSSVGRKLLAHELTHVVQQNGENVLAKHEEKTTASSPGKFASSDLQRTVQGKLSLSRSGDIYEEEADRVAGAFSRQEQQPTPADDNSAGLSRQPIEEEEETLQAKLEISDPMLQRISYDNCTPTQEAKVLDSHNRAIEMLDNAIAKLGTYNGTTPADVQTSMNRHFHDSSSGLAGWIRFNLQYLRLFVNLPQYECQSTQSIPNPAWTMWCVPFTDIELYPNWFSSSRDYRAALMIHEWVHHYGCNFDLGYVSSPGYSGHSTARALLNADPWQWLVYEIR
jgi:hypothetical protein